MVGESDGGSSWLVSLLETLPVIDVNDLVVSRLRAAMVGVVWADRAAGSFVVPLACPSCANEFVSAYSMGGGVF